MPRDPAAVRHSTLSSVARVSFTFALTSLAATAAALAELPYAGPAGQSIVIATGSATVVAAFSSGLTAAFRKETARLIGFGAAAIAAVNALLFVLLALAVEGSRWFCGVWAAGLFVYAGFVAHRFTGWPADDREPPSQLSIFISYRREDGRDTVGRIHDHLRQAFDERRLFLDVERQSAGEDYRVVIDRAIAQADVLLAVIGPSWVVATDANGQRRLDHASDMVRLELEAAFGRNLRIVPVLIEGASMPRAADLPPSLRPLIYLTAVAVRPDPDFKTDMPRLIGSLRRSQELRAAGDGGAV